MTVCLRVHVALSLCFSVVFTYNYDLRLLLEICRCLVFRVNKVPPLSFTVIKDVFVYRLQMNAAAAVRVSVTVA